MARQSWTFTITHRASGETLTTITVEAKKQSDIVAALEELKAPLSAVRLASKGAAGQVRRFNWETPLTKVVGVRG